MRDHNQLAKAQLPPANHAPGCPGSNQVKALFLDDWPAPAKCLDDSQLDSVAMSEVRKWRLQTLLAVSPFGLPSLAIGRAYEKMFGKKFDLKDFGCDNIDALLNKMSDILVVQMPSTTTALLFPEHPHDKVLHDIRLGHDFSKPNFDDEDASTVTSMTNDFNDIIYHAWIDRDQEFPPDVVLIGEPYEQLLKISLANFAGSRGLYRANLISAANPDSIFIRLQTSEENLQKIRGLSAEISAYFKNSEHPIDAYNVPKEFITPNFPCLLYSKEREWERCVVVGSASGGNKIMVECIDFGGVYAVHLIFLYLIPKKFLDIPRQTLAVSMVGLKPPSSAQDWPNNSGRRLRCFSIPDYWLDILLVEKREKTRKTFQRSLCIDKNSASPDSSNTSPTSPGSTIPNESADMPSLASKKKRTITERSSYDAIIVDRNDTDMDILLDEILVMETYAIRDTKREDEIEQLKGRLKAVLKNIPRPMNPLSK